VHLPIFLILLVPSRGTNTAPIFEDQIVGISWMYKSPTVPQEQDAKRLKECERTSGATSARNPVTL